MKKVKRILSAFLVIVMLMTVAPLDGLMTHATALTGSTTEEKIWNFFKSKGLNNYGVAGLMGNLYAESALNSKNLQNSYESKLGYTDSTYTTAVDNGKYTKDKFIHDSAGYGLAQWTYYSRKQGLYNLAKSRGTSIGDLETQLTYCYNELSSKDHIGVLNTLKNAKTLKEASDSVLLNYEKPANASSKSATRLSYAEKYYNQFVGGSSSSSSTSTASSANFANDIIAKARSQKGSYGSDTNAFTKWFYGKTTNAMWCAIFVSWCANEVGVLNKAIPKKAACADMVKWFKDRGEYHSESGYTPQKGDIVFFSTDGTSTAHHVEFVSESGFITENSKKKVKCIGGNTSDANFKGGDYVAEKKRWVSEPSCKILGYAHPSYPNSTSYSISSVSSSNLTNTSAKITANLSATANVSKWTYFLSTNKTAVTNINGADGNTHKTTSTVDCIRILDYTSSPKSLKTDSFTITKFQSNPLKPGTTYYYRLTVYISGKWYQTGVNSFTTTATKPGKPTLRVASGSANIGIGDQATVLWDGTSNTDSYTITIKNSAGSVVKTQTGIKGTTQAFNCFSTAGTYNATISSVNGAGTTTGNTVNIVVYPNCTVTFYDTISKKNIAQVTVPYGHAANAPKNPTQVGHTFSKWDKSFDKVTSDITINTVYDKNSYKVRFIDSFTKKVLKTQTVKYLEAATAPNATPPETGYSLIGWDKDFSAVKSDMDVYTVFKWTDKDHNSTVTINSVKRNSTKQGYDVTITISNKIDKIISGRSVFVLKSKNLTILTSTESEAFAIDANGSKTLTTFIPYEGLAYTIRVYNVNEFDKLGVISNTATKDIDNSSSTAFTDWINYTGSCPMTSGNGVTVETQTISKTTPAKYYYRYKTKTTTTSKATSLSGYTQNGYSLVKNSSGTISYVASWPSGFSTSNSLYTKYNKTPKSASETSTQKIVIDSTATEGYIYWHWCRGGSYGAINRAINWTKSSTYGTFHAFYSTTKKTFNTSANAVEFKNTSACNDTYWWNSMASKNSTLVTVKKQTYTIYDKVYNYYKVSDYSAWKEYTGSVPVANGGSAGTNMTYQNVETKTDPAVTTYTYQYRYKTTTNPTIPEPTVSSAQRINYTINLGSDYANKGVTFWVYKFDQASDYTIELVGSNTLNASGSYTINDVAKEALSLETGDFTVAASVNGQDKAFIVGKIEAPKPKYTVEFYDFNGNVISTQTITEGENATLPSESSLTVPEGMRFTNWSESVVNVRSNMKVFPESETKTYVVAFVNWETKSVELKEFTYGAELVADSIPEAPEGYTSQWVVDVDDVQMTIDEFTEAGKTVTQNMVVGTELVIEKHEIIFMDVDPNNLLAQDVIETGDIGEYDIVDSKEVAYGDNIDFGDVQEIIEDNPDYLFFGWINVDTGEYLTDTTVTDDMILYPSYVFAETTETPYADIENGEYDEVQTVSLSCGTENAVIYYTTDGSDPITSVTAVEYTSPITISKSCTLKYYAMCMGKNDSDVVVSLYAVNTATSGVAYHLVTVVANLPYYDGYNYQALIKDSRMLELNGLDKAEGYIFEGLYLDEVFTDEFYYDAETISESVTIYAKFIPEQYTVTFLDYDGSVISSQNVAYGCSFDAPNPTEREGYVFLGWDNDQYECICCDMTLNPVYISEDEYATVTLNKHKFSTQEGASIKLKVTITPIELSDTELEWMSTDTDVAIVDDAGLVSFVGAGSAEIIVTVLSTGFSDSCAVTVAVDEDKKLSLGNNSYLGTDTDGNIRGLIPEYNTVGQIKDQFVNDGLVFYDIAGNLLSDSDFVGTGATIALYDGDTLLDSAVFIMTGDANCDGKINNRDAAYITRYIVDKEMPNSEFEMIALDANGDGKVNNRDASMLSRYLVGKETL